MRILFEDKEVQRLLDDFQKLVGVRIAVFDIEFNELYSSPKNMSNFCSHIREEDTINELCQFCDLKAFKAAKANKDTYIYKCHLGLYEAVTPIFDKEQILGYVMIGQVLSRESGNSNWDSIISNFPHITKKYKYYYDELKKMPIDEIEAVSRIMKACASSIWLQNIIEIERSPISQKIKNYIADNYAETLTTEIVCRELGLGKTTIYNYLKAEYNMSLNQYISYVRLEQSKVLLKNQDLSISQVSNKVGFEDYNYFSRKFKELYGITPTVFKKSAHPV